jgi:hypothetical protein
MMEKSLSLYITSQKINTLSHWSKNLKFNRLALSPHHDQGFSRPRQNNMEKCTNVRKQN